MALARFDVTVQDAQGRALSGANVYFCTQPANTTTIPPSPLATVFASTAGGTPLAQPLVTDGFGHADAYMADTALYTIVYTHPLFNAPLVYADQTVGGGSGGVGLTPANPSTLAGTITGAIPGSVFTLPSTPAAGSLNLQRNGIVQTLGLGYTITGAVITLASALTTAEGLDANYLAAV